MRTLICKIPPKLPFSNGRIYPSFAKWGEGRFSDGSRVEKSGGSGLTYGSN